MNAPPCGRNMEACRQELGLSAAEAARRIGVEPITFYRWREETVIPKWENVVSASKIFRKEPGWFYGENA